MFYYYTEVPSINHSFVKQQGKKIDLAGICETIEDIFACFPESYSHKMTQKEGKLVSRVWSGCQLFTVGFLKMDQIQNYFFSNKLKQVLSSGFNNPCWIYSWQWSDPQEREPLLELIHWLHLPSWLDIMIFTLLEEVSSLTGVQDACLVLQTLFLKSQIFQAQQLS